MRLTTELLVAGLTLAAIPHHTAIRDVMGGGVPVPAAAKSAITPIDTADDTAVRTPRAFGIGERAVYDVRFGVFKAGTGTMEFVGLDTIRDRPAFQFLFTVNGGVSMLVMSYHVSDTLQSWVDTLGFNSLRFLKDMEEGGKTRRQAYEIYPERRVFMERGKPGEQPSVADPLDDASFLYFVRMLRLEVGKTYEYGRYFKTASNPVKLVVLRKERMETPAGEFNTIVVQPIIKTRGMFSEGGRAEVWINEEPPYQIVRINSRLPIGSLDLKLKSYRASAPPPARRP